MSSTIKRLIGKQNYIIIAILFLLSLSGLVILQTREIDDSIRTLTGHSDWVSSVAWSPDGSSIASGSDDDIGADSFSFSWWG